MTRGKTPSLMSTIRKIANQPIQITERPAPKPWEENWSAHDTDDDGDSFNIIRNGDWKDPVVEHSMCPEDAILAAAAPDMARVLLAVEWAGLDAFNCQACPSCMARQYGDAWDERAEIGPHAPDCALDAALRKAGVR